MQLTDEEISSQLPAAALVAKALHDHISLHKPITRTQVVMLYIAHSIVSGDEEFMNDSIAVVKNEIATRKCPH